MKKSFCVSALIAIFSLPTISHAVISDAQVQQFARSMTVAANAKNVSQVANLIDNSALISISRKGQTSTLDKSAYLNLLQNNWLKASNYHYHININNILITGSQAKADVTTIETLTDKGKNITIVTQSRVTFHESKSGVILGRAISQLTIR